MATALPLRSLHAMVEAHRDLAKSLKPTLAKEIADQVDLIESSAIAETDVDDLREQLTRLGQLLVRLRF